MQKDPCFKPQYNGVLGFQTVLAAGRAIILMAVTAGENETAGYLRQKADVTGT